MAAGVTVPNWLYRANLWIAGVGAWPATIALTLFAVVLAEAAALAVYLLTGEVSIGWVTGTTGVVTIGIGGPIILYSQRVIRRLDASKKELRAITERLALASMRAESADTMKSQFLANMSHELRTPLNAIIGFSEVMAGEHLGPLGNKRYLEYSRDILEAGNHLLAIINDILDLSKIEAGAFEVEMTAVDLGAIARRLERELAPLAAKRTVGIVFALDEGLPPVRGAERLLRQVLTNLISNALKFSHPGGRVEITAERRDRGRLLIRVRDEGIGMTEDEIRVALQPFRQVDGTLKRRHEGTGLGLPLAKSMVELMQGRMLIRSAPDRGTTVELYMKAEEGDRPRAIRAERMAQGATASDLSATASSQR
jgi:signal transduction histidine kinase